MAPRESRGRVRRGLGIVLVYAVVGFSTLAAQVGNDPDFDARMARLATRPNLGSPIDKSLEFVDSEGRTVTLGSFFESGRPVILNPVYFDCPMLCNLVLQGLLDATKRIDWDLGDEYIVLTISIDPEDRPSTAASRRLGILAAYSRPGATGWYFLTDPTGEASRAVCDQIGFHYEYVESQGEIAHPGVIYVLTPEGVLSRYHEDTIFQPEQLKLSLVDASGGAVGTVWDRLSSFCMHWDPATGKYSLTVMGITRVALFGLVLPGLLLIMLVAARGRKRRAREVEPPENSETPRVSVGTPS